MKVAKRCAAILLALVAVAFIPLISTKALAQSSVELELVLAIDASTSVDADEFELQRTGLARAFRHPDVIAAINSLGRSGMAVTVVQWAGAGNQIKAVEWTLVKDGESAFRFADLLSRMTRRTEGFTDIAGAIDFSTRELLNNRFSGGRLTIDVSGDGTADRENPAKFRDRAVEQGIIINGLVIFSNEHDLGDLARYDLQDHYIKYVIGGPGSFLLSAHRFENFAEAIRKKLIREIIGPAFAMR